jgi:predicted dehydrogenase
MSFRLGIIGAGGIAAEHAKAAKAVGIEIAGFCDVVAERAEELAGQYRGAKAAEKVEDLLALKDMPAVAVTTPNCFHKPHAITALEAGKYVFLEKPMGMNVADCDAIIAAEKKSGQFVQVNLICRNSPTALVAADLIKAGRLGRIYHAKASWYRRRGVPGLGRWFTTRAQAGGGVLIDLGVHKIDLVMHLAGHPRALRASGHVTSMFGSPPDRYTYTDMWAGPPNLKGVFDVDDGATGLVRFDNDMTLLATEEDGYLVDVKPHVRHEELWNEAWRRQYEMFVKAVVDRVPPAASAEDGRAVQAVLDALYRSSEEKREVEVA